MTHTARGAFESVILPNSGSGGKTPPDQGTEHLKLAQKEVADTHPRTSFDVSEEPQESKSSFFSRDKALFFCLRP